MCRSSPTTSALAGLAEAEFHLIGHLQSNKARLAAEFFGTIETVDSAKLARRLNEAGKASGSDDRGEAFAGRVEGGRCSKELPGLIEAIHGCPNLQLTGLMTMPPWNPDPETTRPYFRSLAELARTMDCPSFRWECRTTLRPPSKKARRTCAWERRCLGRDPKLPHKAMKVGSSRRCRPRPPESPITVLRLFRSSGAAEPWSAPETCDVALYHVGNNALHREIYQRALTNPGVVVLHDAVLQHLLLGMLGERIR